MLHRVITAAIKGSFCCCSLNYKLKTAIKAKILDYKTLLASNALLNALTKAKFENY